MKVKKAIDLNSQAYQKKGKTLLWLSKDKVKSLSIKLLDPSNKSSTSLLHFPDN